MILVALGAALLAGQLWAVSRAWLGPVAPDPLVIVGTALALSCPRRQLPWVAMMVGWVRALVLIEPAGGQVLCAWAAMVVVAAVRRGLRRQGRSGVLLGGLLLALVWWCSAAALSWVWGASVIAGEELFWGVLAGVPLLWVYRPSERLAGAHG